MYTPNWLSEEGRQFQETVRRLFSEELEPNIEHYEAEGAIPRSFWYKMAGLGILCPSMPVEYGGGGVDFTFNMLIGFECGYTIGGTNLGITIHSDIVAYYILNGGADELKQSYLPRMATGEMVGGLALTEPGAGSDLQGITMTAAKDGEHYVLNGQKTFISNGQNADFFVVACKTDPKGGARGISLFVVDADLPGFTRGRNLGKIGQKAADTSELFFEDVRVPVGHMVGEEGTGFFTVMSELPRERLAIAVKSIGAAQRSYELTRDYIEERSAFGKKISQFQNTQFKMAEMKTQLTAAWALVDQSMAKMLSDELTDVDSAMTKLFVSEVEGKVVDECLQLFGGWGYMTEYPISRFYTDARVRRIFGGTSEIMKVIISRHL